jgi:hypothetical protein
MDPLIADYVSELTPVIAAELAAAGYPHDELAERIAKRVVLKQLDIRDLDDLRRS